MSSCSGPNGDVHYGQHVFFGRHSGTEVTIDGEELLVLAAEDILAVTV